MSIEIISIILTGISVLLSLLLWIVRSKIKNEYKVNRSTIDYLPDNELRNEMESNQNNTLYCPIGDTAEVIDQYVIRQLKRKKALMCRYRMILQHIVFHVFLFDESKRLIDHYLIKQSGSFRHSQVIVLPKACAFVNLKIENMTDSNGVTRTEKFHKQIFAARLQSYILLLMFFPVTYASFLIRGRKSEYKQFIEDINVVTFVGLMVIFSLIYYKVNISSFRKKRYTTGGSA